MGYKGDWGVTPRAIADVFAAVEHRRRQAAAADSVDGSVEEWSVVLSYLEVYNEKIYDLLTAESRKLAPREDPALGRVMVAGLEEVAVSSQAQVLQARTKHEQDTAGERKYI